MSDNPPIPDISIVVPVFNEADNLPPLYDELSATLDAYGRAYEVVFVDDGSSDGSYEILRGLNAKDARYRVVRFARNFGQNPALYAGFAYARGQVVVTLDADLQNPPSEIPILVDALEQGHYHVVQGWRTGRKDHPLRKLASRIVNRIMSRLTGIRVRDLGSGMKAYRRSVVDQLNLSRHRSRYVPAEVAWLGVPVGEVEVAHRSRHAGASKYNLLSLLRVNFDMIASVSTAPVQLIGWLGAVFAMLGFAMTLFIGALRIIYGNYSELATIAAVFFFLAGVQMLATALLCQYVTRIYVEVQQRPYYIVDETHE